MAGSGSRWGRAGPAAFTPPSPPTYALPNSSSGVTWQVLDTSESEGDPVPSLSASSAVSSPPRRARAHPRTGAGASASHRGLSTRSLPGMSRRRPRSAAFGLDHPQRARSLSVQHQQQQSQQQQRELPALQLPLARQARQGGGLAPQQQQRAAGEVHAPADKAVRALEATLRGEHEGALRDAEARHQAQLAQLRQTLEAERVESARAEREWSALAAHLKARNALLVTEQDRVHIEELRKTNGLRLSHECELDRVHLQLHRLAHRSTTEQAAHRDELDALRQRFGECKADTEAAQAAARKATQRVAWEQGGKKALAQLVDRSPQAGRAQELLAHSRRAEAAARSHLDVAGSDLEEWKERVRERHGREPTDQDLREAESMLSAVFTAEMELTSRQGCTAALEESLAGAAKPGSDPVTVPLAGGVAQLPAEDHAAEVEHLHEQLQLLNGINSSLIAELAATKKLLQAARASTQAHHS